jgi:uncharacterized protein (TIGR00369 family)
MSAKAGAGHNTKGMKPRRNTCFGCGPQNPDGMRLRFALDEARQRFVGRFRIPRRFQGPPGHVHGGIIATILDEAMGKVNKLRNVIALTRHMEVEYLKPVPLSQMLIVESHEVSHEGRKHVNAAEIRNEAGDVLARGRATFIAVDAERMFAKHMAKANSK